MYQGLGPKKHYEISEIDRESLDFRGFDSSGFWIAIIIVIIAFLVLYLLYYLIIVLLLLLWLLYVNNKHITLYARWNS